MRYLILFTTFFINFFSHADNTKVETERPANFIDVGRYMPEIQIDIRYFSENNFIGRKIAGYQASVCLLTRDTAQALKTVVEQLLPMGLTLKVYDCYRPQSAVNDFVQWAKDINNTTMRDAFYPTIDKRNLFRDGYIAFRSGHSRGDTVDLTIVPIDSQIPAYDPALKLVNCTAPQKQRSPDNSLDFGTSFDCFDTASHPLNEKIPVPAKANRLLLNMLMKQAGFKGLDTEWWHFTFTNQPTSIYYDFPVK